ncbi:hypothetical protein LMF32_11980 [Desemzia sp. C1]|uniref:hypothetical protein n=1 Tax=Desemzia sp. C1 TaxID=2892016 RepID=UPI001E4E4705|nr:hypothetical protein [Desemzia sp. C1]MCI3029763.1 hypothetical protein [Desemzia sp. C1]
MNEQEKLFADEFVFRYFNSNESNGRVLAVQAAIYTGYKLPTDVSAADAEAQKIYNKPAVKEYIENEVSELRDKLQLEQRRYLWKDIKTMTIGEPDDWDHHGVIRA